MAAAMRELVARRCQMVCQLGAAFWLGPTPGAFCVACLPVCLPASMPAHVPVDLLLPAALPDLPARELRACTSSLPPLSMLLLPAAVSVPEAPPGGYLEDRLELQWAGAGTPGGSGGGGGGGGIGAQQPRVVPGGGGVGGRGGGGQAIDSPSKYQ